MVEVGCSGLRRGRLWPAVCAFGGCATSLSPSAKPSAAARAGAAADDDAGGGAGATEAL